MKRDLDLVRRILLDIEERGDGAQTSGWAAFVEDGYTVEAIQYHVQLLNDAGLIQADELVPGQWWPERMTWAGHEFLDAARNDKLWVEAKRRVQDKVGSAPFQLVHDLLIHMVQESLARKPRKRRRRK
jgi:hypothetical protein